MRRILLIIAKGLFTTGLICQNVLDGAWNKNILDREPLAYPEIREADVFWSKRIWRIIDTREKMNQIFSYPQLPLVEILHQEALKGNLVAYDNTVLKGDQFIQQLPVEGLNSIGTSTDSVWIINETTLQEEQKIIVNDFDYDKVKRFKIKEDWFFNSATSTMEVRIIGIAPLLETFDEEGNYIGDETMYWLYYPDLRTILAKHEAYNPLNNGLRLSWDDIFEARLFSSYIYKEDNVHDRNIQEYAADLDALYESERIKEKIFNFEHDLWSY